MLQQLKAYDPHQPMDVDSLAQRFPTLNTTRAHESRSDRFAHISTMHVLRRLVAEGFTVHGVQVQRVKHADRFGWEKHSVRLRLPSNHTSFNVTRVGDVFPEVILRNANDGTASYEFIAGLMRLICLNGMAVGSQWGSVRVTHAGKDRDAKVIDATYSVVDSFGKLGDKIAEWRGIELAPTERLEFARSAMALRYDANPETGELIAPVGPASILEARRHDDTSSDLWTVFNRVQENLVRGGQPGMRVTRRGNMQRARTRELTGIDSALSFNRRLFDLADAYAGNAHAPAVSDRAAFAPVLALPAPADAS